MRRIGERFGVTTEKARTFLVAIFFWVVDPTDRSLYVQAALSSCLANIPQRRATIKTKNHAEMVKEMLYSSRMLLQVVTTSGLYIGMLTFYPSPSLPHDGKGMTIRI